MTEKKRRYREKKRVPKFNKVYSFKISEDERSFIDDYNDFRRHPEHAGLEAYDAENLPPVADVLRQCIDRLTEPSGWNVLSDWSKALGEEKKLKDTQLQEAFFYNRLLVRLGRNVNQIARALNTANKAGRPLNDDDVQVIADAICDVENIRSKIDEVIGKENRRVIRDLRPVKADDSR